jgi:hypothetical protein
MRTVALAPHWLDIVVMQGRNPAQIAHAIAHSTPIQAAIARGLEAGRHQVPGIKGPGKAQLVRLAIIEAINDTDGIPDEDWGDVGSLPPTD